MYVIYFIYGGIFMRKKFLSMFIALTMLSTFIPMTVSADSDFDHLQYDNVQCPFSKPIDVVNAAAALTITSHSNGMVVSITSMVISLFQLGKK